MTDEQAQWDALKALLTAGEIGDHVYDFGRVPGEKDVPGDTPDAFVLLSVERRYVAPNRAGGTDRTGWRVSCRFVDTSAANARLVGGWVRAALESTPGRGRRITVNGVTSTPITHETTSAVEADDGRYSGLSQWTYAL